MKISAVLWSKDEAGLLARSVAQLLRSGVSSVSIMDDRSTDGTEIVIDTLCATLPNVHRIPLVENLQAALTMDGPVFGPILARDAPDWLVVTDPDEFWISRKGDLRKASALRSHDVVVVERYNAALSDADGIGPHLESQEALLALPLVTDKIALNPKRMAEQPELRWINHRVNPKLMVRPDRVLKFGLGMHEVAAAEEAVLRRARGQDIVVAHLPFTEFSRFKRKVQNIARVFERFDADHQGMIAWHWRRWLEIAGQGGLHEEYDRQFFAPDALEAMRAAGQVATAAEIFAARQAEAEARKTKAAGH